MKILVTGAAGFIDAAVAQQLLNRGDEVISLPMNPFLQVQAQKYIAKFSRAIVS